MSNCSEAEKPRILMVDDNHQNLHLQRQQLQSEPWSLSIATNGEDAIRLVERVKPDLVLLDVMMPGIDGFETCRRIKELPLAKEIPVLFVTANKADLEQGFAAGGVDYVTKPVSSAELICRIRLHLKLTHTMRALERQIVDRERLAELGELVGGLTHEISNVLGICLTAASSLDNVHKQTSAAYQGKSLNSQNFEKFLAFAGEVSELIQEHTKDANEILGSFHELAVDQASQRTRSFQLDEFCTTLIRSMHPRLKKSCLQVELDVDPAIRLRVQPGVLAQILRNLILNSLIHGYAPDEQGRITIRARPKDQGFTLVYEDDGQGMSAEILHRAFDKFFTTRSEIGGSGLGLHLVEQLSANLGGTVTASSEPGKGVRMQFNFPACDIGAQSHNQLATGTSPLAEGALPH